MEESEKTENLRQALETWRRGGASVREIQSLAADLGNQHFAPGIPTLIQLLDHEDEIVRYNAVNSLAFEFHYEPVADKLVTMLTLDSDSDCRGAAAGGLGTLCRNSKDRRVLSALGEAALNDTDEYVRSSAYKALQIVNGVSPAEYLELLMNRSLSVEPELVKAILAGCSGLRF
jgi:HEAT repeat protein